MVSSPPSSSSSLKRSRQKVVVLQKYYKSTISPSSSAASNLLKQSNPLFRPIGVTPIPVQIAIGCASASYWRGMWYILDDNLFPNDPTASASASLIGGTLGLATVQGVMAKKAEYYASKEVTKLPSYYPKMARFGTLYIVATSCILVWRGAWMGCDIIYEQMTDHSPLEPGHLTVSGVWTHVVATCGLLAFGRFSSVLGPPARLSILEDMAFKAKTWQQYSKAAKWFFK